MKVKTSKGFTLAELLIVMAIIVVLSAIAIPTFGKQLETAREASDVENIRAALTDAFTLAYVDYANAQEWTHGTTVTADGDDKGYGKYTIEDIAITQAENGFQYIKPQFRVGDTGTPVTFPTGSGAYAFTAATAIDVTFEFSPGPAGSESEIQLYAVTAKAHA